MRIACQALIAVTLAAGRSLPAQAAYLWAARTDDGAVSLRLGELSSPRADDDAGTLLAPRAFLADGKALPLSRAGSGFAVEAGASGDVRAEARQMDGQGGLTIYHARAGRSETRAVSDLELVPTRPDGNTFRLFWKGKPVAADRVNVQTSAQWNRSLQAAKDGSVTLDTPFPGRYLLEVSVRVNGAVTVDGKRYEAVRHTATTSFEVGK